MDSTTGIHRPRVCFFANVATRCESADRASWKAATLAEPVARMCLSFGKVRDTVVRAVSSAFDPSRQWMRGSCFQTQQIP